jgi:hypothetical protein
MDDIRDIEASVAEDRAIEANAVEKLEAAILREPKNLELKAMLKEEAHKLKLLDESLLSLRTERMRQKNALSHVYKYAREGNYRLRLV